MSSRNRGPSNAIKGGGGGGLPPPLHEPPFNRGGFLPLPHPALLEEMRREEEFSRGGGGPGGPLPLLPHRLEDRLAVQHQEIQALLVDNQRLAATHVALKQELESSQHELQRMVHFARSMQAEQDVHFREVVDKSMKMEADLRSAEGMKGELLAVRGDIQKLSASKQELSNQVQALSQDLAKAHAEMQQAPALKAEVESMKQVLQRARAAIDYEKKGYAENYEHGQAMEGNLVSMARELEKLRAEVSNAEKRAQAAAAAAAVGNTGAGYGGNTGAGYGGNTGAGYGGNAGAGYGGNTGAGYGGNTGAGYGGNATAGYVGNTSAGYGGNYSNPDTAYAGNPYPAGYGMNPAQGGAEGSTQYGSGPGAYGAYDMQRARR